MNEKDDKLNKGSFLYINDKEKAEWGYPEGYPHKGIGTILDGTFEFENSSGIYQYQFTDENFNIVDGKSYTIIWDVETYQCITTIVNGGIAFGNLSMFGQADTGEPFIFTMSTTGTKMVYIYTMDTAATHTITVRGETFIPFSPNFLPQATQTTYGAIKKAAHVPHVTEAPTSNDFNKLLSALREAGIMRQSE